MALGVLFFQAPVILFTQEISLSLHLQIIRYFKALNISYLRSFLCIFMQQTLSYQDTLFQTA